MGEIAMFESRVCVRLRLFVMADLVKIGRLVVMVRGGVVVSGRLIVMLSRQLLLWHLRNSSRERAGVRVFRAAALQGLPHPLNFRFCSPQRRLLPLRSRPQSL